VVTRKAGKTNGQDAALYSAKYTPGPFTLSIANL
jgi:hypothetical protein